MHLTETNYFLQDINNSGDGGLYAELIRNRAFQSVPGIPATLDGWTSINGAKLSLTNLTTPLSKVLPTSLNVAAGKSKGAVGFKNDGFWGIDVKQKKYSGSFVSKHWCSFSVASTAYLNKSFYTVKYFRSMLYGIMDSLSLVLLTIFLSVGER